MFFESEKPAVLQLIDAEIDKVSLEYCWITFSKVVCMRFGKV